MGQTAQLRLLQPVKAQANQPQISSDPARRVFEHWVAMMGKRPGLTKMGPTRSAVINSVLTLYDEDQLCAAIEGMAADPLTDCVGDKMRDAMREVEWLLAREARIERWAERGYQLRDTMAQAEDQARRGPALPEADAAPDPAAVAARTAQMRALAMRLRAQGR